MVVDFTREVYTLNDIFLCIISRYDIPFLVEYHLSLPLSYFVVISLLGFVSANFISATKMWGFIFLLFSSVDHAKISPRRQSVSSQYLPGPQ